jgi:hypothetical protein
MSMFPVTLARHPHPARATHTWGTVHVSAAITVHAPPDRLVARYLDFAQWPQLFAATIRGTRLVQSRGDEMTVEVDHRTAGRVINVIRPRSPNEIELGEFKPKFEATFLNRFDPIPEGTRYTVVADVKLKMPYALLAPFLTGYVRRAVRRYVLEPMRDVAERSTAA